MRVGCISSSLSSTVVNTSELGQDDDAGGSHVIDIYYIIITECFGAQEVDIFFFALFEKELRASHAKKKLRYFLSMTDIHTHIHTHTRLGQINSLKGSYLNRPKCKPLGNHISLYSL